MDSFEPITFLATHVMLMSRQVSTACAAGQTMTCSKPASETTCIPVFGP